MSLADYVRLRADSELELAIELKYGRPSPAKEYVDRLPLTVVKRVYSKISGRALINGKEDPSEESMREGLVSFLTLWNLDYEIKQELLLYHSLLGRV